MPKEKNQHKSAAASDEKFRDFFTTTVADIPAEMVRREEEAAEEHKGLFGRLFGHAKPKQAPQAGTDLELPTGEVLLGADALAKHDGEEPLDLDLTLRTADPGTDFPQPKAEVPAAPEKPAVPDRPAPQPAPENKPEPPKAPAAPAPQPEKPRKKAAQNPKNAPDVLLPQEQQEQQEMQQLKDMLNGMAAKPKPVEETLEPIRSVDVPLDDPEEPETPEKAPEPPRPTMVFAADKPLPEKKSVFRMFGDADPVGRSLVAEGKSYTVSAVMRDIERSVIPPVDLLYRGDLLTKKNNNNESMSNVGSCCTFLLAREGADLRAKLPDMLDYFKTIYLPYTRGFYRQVTLLPLREVYFSSLDSYGNLSSGNRSFVTILMAIGIVILLFAVINYVNLTAAQTGFRAKEMATRRLLGATKGEVVLKLILESTLMCCTAFAVAFLLAEAAEPYAARLLGAKIDISAAATPERIAWYALFLLALGFVSGIVPATLVARYKPVDVMRGSLRHRTKQVYSKVLIVIQNAITVAMLATSLTVYAQTRHLIDAPLGYDTKDILMLRHDIFDGYDQMRRLRDELCSEPSVEAVAFSNATPLTKGSNWTMQYDGGRMISFEYFVADSVFFRILGLELLRDNHTEGWGFNQYAFKQMDIPEDTPGVRLANIEDPVSVAGIYRDFRFGSVLEKPTAMILWNIGDFDRFWNGKKLSAPRFPGYMLVKTRGDHDEAYATIRSIFERINDDGFFEGRYFEQQIADFFADEQRTLRIVGIFTLAAILISALGLLAMSTYYMQQKQQETAVRKVFGATRREMLRRLVGNFMAQVAVAFLIAVPVAWYALDRWLQDYSVRIRLGAWIFLAAGAFAATVALATVFWQSSRAAAANPVDTLKN